MARTINSPGVEIKEYDLSERATTTIGTNVLTMGFAAQGPTNELIQITSKDELNETFFGGNGPTNDAEQYFYHSVSELLDSPANVYTVRLPYGVDNGDGFNGKYVALAYGGRNVYEKKTERVRRNSKEDDFIPESTAAAVSGAVTLTEFTSSSITSSNSETKPIYDQLCTFVSGSLGKTVGSGGPFEFASAFPVDFEKFWTASGTCISASPLKEVSGYEVSAFKPKENNSVSAFFPVMVSPQMGLTADIKDIASGSWAQASGADDAPIYLPVVFENFGHVTEDFNTNTLLSKVELWSNAIQEAVVSDIPVLRGVGTVAIKVTTGEGTATYSKFYKVDFTTTGTSASGFDTMLTSGRCLASANVCVHTPYSGAPVDVYVDTANGLVDAQKSGKELIVDTEEIGNKLVNETAKILTKHHKGFDIQNDAVRFENGIPMQDKNTQTVSYHGPFKVEAQSIKKFGRDYQVAVFNNTIAKDKIVEIEVDDPVLDKDGNFIYENHLYINPNPIAIPLTNYQYSTLKEGAVDYKDPEYMLEGYATGTEDSYRDVLSHAAFYIINKMQSTVDENNQGFYVAMMDNEMFVKRANAKTKAEIENSYSAVDQIRLVGEATNGSYEMIPSTILPKNAYAFELFGSDGLNSDLMNSIPTDIMTTDQGRNNLVISTIRCGKYSTASDPTKLIYDMKTVTYGSFDPTQTVTDPVTKGIVLNGLDKKVENSSDYIELIMNEKFNWNENKVDMAVFGGSDYPNRNRKSGSCCSIGPSAPCTENNTAKYIGSIPAKIENALGLCDSVTDMDLDIVIDAGLSTIWAYVSEDSSGAKEGVFAGDCEFKASKYILNDASSPYGMLKDSENAMNSIYYLACNEVLNKYKTFCSQTRKDCIFVMDALRACFVRGRDTKLMDIEGKVFSLDVERPLRSLFANVNTSYGCVYANWVKIFDSFSNTYIWMPSSAYEAAIMAKLDSDYYCWYAPFGLNYGKLSTISDIALRTNQKQQDALYKMGINMFVYFNGDGFVAWGQKTLQSRPSALDRINVRRCFLYLERSTMKTARYYIGEPNTEFTRTRFTNALTPVFDTVMANEGVYDYRIVCTENNNTPEVIDNNEMVVDIYVKPVRTAEFILCNFYCTRTDANFDELIG